jgi:hypothetical protein
MTVQYELYLDIFKVISRHVSFSTLSGRSKSEYTYRRAHCATTI